MLFFVFQFSPVISYHFQNQTAPQQNWWVKEYFGPNNFFFWISSFFTLFFWSNMFFFCMWLFYALGIFLSVGDHKILGMSKRASPARFDLARFWPDLYGPGRAGPQGWNGLHFWTRPASWRAGGLTGWPAGFFPYFTFSIQNQISTKLLQQKQPCSI